MRLTLGLPGSALCGSPGIHPRALFPDGDFDGERAWPCCLAIMQHRSMADLFLSLIDSLRCSLRTRANRVVARVADQALRAEKAPK
jgi:hypothetical protein